MDKSVLVAGAKDYSAAPITRAQVLEAAAAILNKDHGSPYDRGGADSYYCRAIDPHYWPEGTGRGTRVEMAEMTAVQVQEYLAGYHENEVRGIKKF